MNETKKPVKITELVLRDAHQSLLATRMRTEDMIPACEAIDKAGFYSVECWGGATFDACLRFLKEDPWERLRVLRKALPNSKLQMLLRGQNILGYRHYADDVVERFVDKSAEYGMDIYRIFDALNDMRNIEWAVKCVRKSGKHAQGAICYTVSPVHTHEMFVQQGKQLEDMGCDSIVIKDMAALMCPEPAYALVKALKAAVKIPVHVHTHSTTGVAPMVLVRSIQAGADGVDTAISALSGGSGHVCTEAMVETIAGTEYDSEIKQESLTPIAKHFRAIRPKYKEFESNFQGSDPRIFLSQIPGGMISNMESQMKEMGCLDRLDEVMEEIPHVRKDMGYIPLVTPTSQIVGTQAVMNVIMGERYKTVPQNSKDIFAGRYGTTPVPVDTEVQKKVMGKEEPITCRPADVIENEWDKLKEEIKDLARNDDDVLSYAIFPQVWKEFMAHHEKKEMVPEAKPQPAAPAPPATTPVQPNVPLPQGAMRLGLNIEGKDYEMIVEVLEE